MSTYTESIHIARSPDQIGAFVGGVHNLPRWCEFRSVGPSDGDRHQAVNAHGATTATRVDGNGPLHRYTISSLVDDREERVELAVIPAAAGADVSITVTADVAPAVTGAADETTQRGCIRGQLRRLRSAITELTAACGAGHGRHAPARSLPSGETVY